MVDVSLTNRSLNPAPVTFPTIANWPWANVDSENGAASCAVPPALSVLGAGLVIT